MYVNNLGPDHFNALDLVLFKAVYILFDAFPVFDELFRDDAY